MGTLINIKNKKILLGFLINIILAIVLGGWYYFGWYMSEKQILARCYSLVTTKVNECYNNKWVKEAGSEFWAKYHINSCFNNHYTKCLLENGLMRLPRLE